MSLLTQEPLVSVCVCTYKRPELLHDLLQTLATQQCKEFSFEVVIVDNDDKGSAKHIIEKAKCLLPQLSIKYEIEPEQGISFARNRTVQMAIGQYLAFIDDDEVASATWLCDLLDTLNKYHADAVFGPVIPYYPEGTPDWVINCHFFKRPRFSTGTEIQSGNSRTSNALIGAHWCKRRLPAPFDLKFAWSGGEDHDFFKWVECNGGRFYWSDSATVSEIVPLSRQKLHFMLERSLRTSIVFWRGVNVTRSTWRAVVEALAGTFGGIIFCFAGCCQLPLGLHKAVRVWCTAMKCFGRLLALSNYDFIGYGDTQE